MITEHTNDDQHDVEERMRQLENLVQELKDQVSNHQIDLDALKEQVSATK